MFFSHVRASGPASQNQPTNQNGFHGISEEQARAWAKKLRKYRSPDHARSMFEIAATLVPYALLWSAALWLLPHSHIAAATLALPLGLLTLRMGVLQHEAGHGSLFRTRRANNLVGRPLGVLSLTPYGMWRKMHGTHHADMGNLDARDIGEVHTMTLAEYRDNPGWKRLAYRIYRNPVFLMTLAPFWLFIFQHRLPFGMWKDGAQVWASAMATNVAIFAFLAGLYAYGGWEAILVVWLPSMQIAAMLGVWLFYTQHQFETAQLDRRENWSHYQKALISSSHLALPAWLAWVTANLGVHHIHHLSPSIPFYRLKEVLANEPELDRAHKLTWHDTLACFGLHLWDEDQRRMISFAEAREMAG